jgi:uroporphyrinogen-III synthase
MLVLVTRPAAQAARTAAILRQRGHKAIIDPVLEIRAIEPRPPLDLGGVAALAVTSANAASALAGLATELPVYAVGAATAAACRAQGSFTVSEAAGDGASLAESIAADLTPPATVLHLAGEEVREGLEAGLAARGLGYRAVAVYAAQPSPGLAPDTLEALSERRLDTVLLYSPRSAALWQDLVAKAGLTPALAGVTALCLSAAVAAPLARETFKSVRIAASPDQDALLRCLEAGQ